ncbi:hypothetical protein I7I51_08041 [Histoplasma capsulatum]|uniref:Uncharacterized protein n=1 Tax=Ajellomyces capsulatus TaxID=5037 RepID=A0A8A1M1S6_AJECA|nr:hypothetical protein I7I51_08041 [Histoplasma capsulatum]
MLSGRTPRGDGVSKGRYCWWLPGPSSSPGISTLAEPLSQLTPRLDLRRTVLEAQWQLIPSFYAINVRLPVSPLVLYQFFGSYKGPWDKPYAIHYLDRPFHMYLLFTALDDALSEACLHDTHEVRQSNFPSYLKFANFCLPRVRNIVHSLSNEGLYPLQGKRAFSRGEVVSPPKPFESPSKFC